jgi:choline dehydrogenase-like flavoprotein
MIEDLRRLESGSELETDLCVIGSGAAGIAIAREFFGTDTRVLVLESGGLSARSGGQGLNGGESSGLGPASLTEGRGRSLGGSTALWAGQCLPPGSAMLERRAWVPYSGWPFERVELEPYLQRAEALFAIEGEVYDERVWAGFGVDPSPVDPERLLHRFSVWCPQPNLGRLYRQRLKGSSNVSVLLNATVTELCTTDSGERLNLVRVATPEGKRVEVRPRACLLCTGGVENARLLLASRGTHAEGLGNRYYLVGRFFQDHPNGYCATIEPANAARLQELYGLLYRRRVRYLPRLVLGDSVQRSAEVLSCAAHPVFDFGETSGIEAARRVYRAVRAGRRPERLARELGRIGRDAVKLVPVGYRRMTEGRSAQSTPARVLLQTHAEQAPDPDSRVTLATRRDRLGVPLPKVDWRLSELDRRTAETMVDTVAEEFHRLGLGEVRRQPWLDGANWRQGLNDSFHHMGTTRLGSDPKTSVLDRDCRVHGVAGLYVAGSSVFPACGYANPTLTIAAMAIRLGDHLKARLGGPRIC